MNILYWKYAVEVARTQSINQAAETLFVAQPNLSRSIKALESDLGITIFERSAKGMFLTPEGEKFISYAQRILDQIDDVEKLYKEGLPATQQFSISVPRASYISDAFARFSTCISAESAEIFYKETNSSEAIKNIIAADYRLGIIRYAASYDRYFKEMLEEKGLCYELVAEFTYALVMNGNSPLASLAEIRFSDLEPLIEIAHADPYVPYLPLATVKKEELPDNITRHIFVFERGSQFELLSQNPETFMWVSPLPKGLIERYALVQRSCCDNTRVYKDMLIYKKDYRLSELDKRFITELCASKRAVF